jgi:hypothetical protein
MAEVRMLWDAGLASRVERVKQIALTEIVRAAGEFDVTPSDSDQTREALLLVESTLDEVLRLARGVTVERGWGGTCPTCGTHVSKEVADDAERDGEAGPAPTVC